MRVEVYFNLHKYIWSVRSAKTGRVILHTDKVHIRNPEFVVRQAGRERVLREGKKNVHAFVRGEATYFDDFDPDHHPNYLDYTLDDFDYENRPMLDIIGYNPYKYVGFVKMPDEKLVRNADRAYMQVSEGGVPSVYAEGARP